MNPVWLFIFKLFSLVVRMVLSTTQKASKKRSLEEILKTYSQDSATARKLLGKEQKAWWKRIG